MKSWTYLDALMFPIACYWEHRMYGCKEVILSLPTNLIMRKVGLDVFSQKRATISC